MTLRQLEYFVALAREAHFARAAAAGFVSQLALAESVRKLEVELGVPLVQRGNSFGGLTPEGQRLVVWARRILADYDSLNIEVAELRSGLTGQLRLDAIPSASTTVAAMHRAILCRPSAGQGLVAHQSVVRRDHRAAAALRD